METKNAEFQHVPEGTCVRVPLDNGEFFSGKKRGQFVVTSIFENDMFRGDVITLRVPEETIVELLS